MTPTADRSGPDGASPRRGRSKARPLAEVAADVFRGQARPEELHRRFLNSTVWCEAGERPGFVAIEWEGERLIPVFTSLEQLARARGAVAWFSTSGHDLFGLLPKGYDLVLDPGGETPLRLRTAAVRKTARPLVVGWG